MLLRNGVSLIIFLFSKRQRKYGGYGVRTKLKAAHELEITSFTIYYAQQR